MGASVPLFVQRNKQPAATVEFDLAELGAAEPAEGVSVNPCPLIAPRPSPQHHLVTGGLVSQAASGLDLYVDGLAEPTGMTANHPFWSEDNNGWNEFQPVYQR